jgi:hypothetical protein
MQAEYTEDTDDVFDENIFDSTKEDEAHEETEQIEIEEPTDETQTEERTETDTNNAPQSTVEPPKPKSPQQYEQIVPTTSWMPLYVLKQALMARKKTCRGKSEQLVKELDDYNQNVQVKKLETPFSDRNRYRFYITLWNTKIYRVLSVPKDTLLGELVELVLVSFGWDTSHDFEISVANEFTECDMNNQVDELELYDGDVLEIMYQGWPISLLLTVEEKLDTDVGPVLRQISGQAPKLEDSPNFEHFPTIQTEKKKKRSKKAKKRRAPPEEEEESDNHSPLVLDEEDSYAETLLDKQDDAQPEESQENQSEVPETPVPQPPKKRFKE